MTENKTAAPPLIMLLQVAFLTAIATLPSYVLVRVVFALCGSSAPIVSGKYATIAYIVTMVVLAAFQWRKINIIVSLLAINTVFMTAWMIGALSAPPVYMYDRGPILVCLTIGLLPVIASGILIAKRGAGNPSAAPGVKK